MPLPTPRLGFASFLSIKSLSEDKEVKLISQTRCMWFYFSSLPALNHFSAQSHSFPLSISLSSYVFFACSFIAPTDHTTSSGSVHQQVLSKDFLRTAMLFPPCFCTFLASFHERNFLEDISVSSLPFVCCFYPNCNPFTAILSRPQFSLFKRCFFRPPQ